MNDSAGPLPAGLGHDDLSADPEVRLTGFMYHRAYDAVPAGAWRAPGALMLLGGPSSALTVALPWGVIVAAEPLAEPVFAAYSMNHHTERFEESLAGLRSADLPGWAAPAARCVAAARPPGGLRLVINRELPDETGLLTGAETAVAVSLALADLYGVTPPAQLDPWHRIARSARSRTALLSGGAAEPDTHLPFDLHAAGLRLMVIDAGVRDGPPAAGAAPGFGGDVAKAAELLRSGDPAGLGALLTEAHEPGAGELDLALSAAWAAGALGGRAIGSCLVALVPVTAVSAVRAAVADHLRGVARRPPRFLTATPAGAARRAL
jgi:galactokinase